MKQFLFNHYHSLGNSRQQTDIFSYFSKKTGFLWRQFAWNVNSSIFSGKNKKKISICQLLKILPRAKPWIPRFPEYCETARVYLISELFLRNYLHDSFFPQGRIMSFPKFAVIRSICETKRQKTYLQACAPSKDSDQPAHLCSLIRIFTGPIQDRQGCKVSSCTQLILWSDSMDAQADLSVFLGPTYLKIRFLLLWFIQSLAELEQFRLYSTFM